MLCVAQRAQASGSVGRLQEKGCQHVFSHASATVKLAMMKLVTADLCSRAASSARVTKKRTSGDSLPETSSVVQHSIACAKSLLSAVLAR